MRLSSVFPLLPRASVLAALLFVACGTPPGGPADSGDEPEPDASEEEPDAGDVTPDAGDEPVDAGDEPVDGGDGTDGGTTTPENTNARCGDSDDNDGDTFIDCADFKCLLGVDVTVCGITLPVTRVTVPQLMTEPPDSARPTPANLDGLNQGNAATKVTNRVELSDLVVTSPLLRIGSRQTPTFFAASASGRFNGLYVFAGETGATIGGSGAVPGRKFGTRGVFQTREAAGGGFQLRAQEFSDQGTTAIPAATSLTMAKLVDATEQRAHQSVLVSASERVAVRSVNAGAGTFEVSALGTPDAKLLVSLEFLAAEARPPLMPQVGGTYTRLIGILHRVSNGYRLLVRSADDLAAGDPLPPDGDADGIADDTDNCPDDANVDQADDDGDSAGDACDNCPDVSNPDQADADENGTGDACQAADDSDNDTVANAQDNCPNVANTDQADADQDQVGDACDNCRNVANTNQADSNNDGVGDACPVTARAPAANELLINEVLVDPDTEANQTYGDSNADGTSSSGDDEFVEIVNTAAVPLILDGVQVHSSGGSGASKKLTLPAYTLPAGKAIVIFGGTATLAPAQGAFGGARVFVVKRDGITGDNKASGLSLTNTSGTLSLKSADGATTLAEFTWGGTSGLAADINASLVRSPEISGGTFVDHQTASSPPTRFSPGTRVNGAAF